MLETVWATALLPALAALVTLLALPRLLRHARAADALRGGVALAAGHLAASASIAGAPAWPPVDARSWLFVLVPLAALVGAATAGVSRRSFTWLAVGCWAALVPVPFLAPRAQYAWTPWQAGALFLAVAVVIALLAWAFERSQAAAGPAGMLAGATGLALAGAPLLFLGASALFGQLSAALAAALAPLVLAALAGSTGTWWRGIVLPLATVFALFGAAGVFYAELPVPAALVALAGPVVAGSVSPWLARRGGRLSRSLLVVLIFVLPALIAIALAFRTYEPAAGYGPS